MGIAAAKAAMVCKQKERNHEMAELLDIAREMQAEIENDDIEREVENKIFKTRLGLESGLPDAAKRILVEAGGLDKEETREKILKERKVEIRKIRNAIQKVEDYKPFLKDKIMDAASNTILAYAFHAVLTADSPGSREQTLEQLKKEIHHHIEIYPIAKYEPYKEFLCVFELLFEIQLLDQAWIWFEAVLQRVPLNIVNMMPRINQDMDTTLQALRMAASVVNEDIYNKAIHRLLEQFKTHKLPSFLIIFKQILLTRPIRFEELHSLVIHFCSALIENDHYPLAEAIVRECPQLECNAIISSIDYQG
jgi:hypothetical protein